MKKILSYFLLFVTICIIISSCGKTESRTSSAISQEKSIPEEESKLSDNNYDTTINFFNLTIPVTFTPEVKISNIYIYEYELFFDYEVRDIQGKANVPLTYSWLKDVDWIEENFLRSISLIFDCDEGKPSLTISWDGRQSDNIYIEKEDCYLFDEKINIWYLKWKNFDLSPVILGGEQVSRIFPNEYIEKNGVYSAFFSDSPIYDVSFYCSIKSESPPYDSEDTLVAYYEEYLNDTVFLWQANKMQNSNLVITYFDVNGKYQVFSYENNNSYSTIIYKPIIT